MSWAKDQSNLKRGAKTVSRLPCIGNLDSERLKVRLAGNFSWVRTPVAGAGEVIGNSDLRRAATNPPEAKRSNEESQDEENTHFVPLEGPIAARRLIHKDLS